MSDDVLLVTTCITAYALSSSPVATAFPSQLIQSLQLASFYETILNNININVSHKITYFLRMFQCDVLHFHSLNYSILNSRIILNPLI